MKTNCADLIDSKFKQKIIKNKNIYLNELNKLLTFFKYFLKTVNLRIVLETQLKRYSLNSFKPSKY